MDTTERYPTDLTNREWAQVARVIPAPKKGGRPAKYDRREITDARLYITRAGCPRRMMPEDLPPWRIVYWYLMLWKEDGTLDRLMDLLCGRRRAGTGIPRRRSSTPSRCGRPKEGAARLRRR